MSFKDLLVFVDALPGGDRRLDLAINLARRYGAHLTGIHVPRPPELETTVAHDVSVADAVLSRAAQIGADLIVMGAYGHSRFHESVFGGATRDVLQQASLPVFMAH